MTIGHVFFRVPRQSISLLLLGLLTAYGSAPWAGGTGEEWEWAGGGG
jgi:hypothetical protein